MDREQLAFFRRHLGGAAPSRERDVGDELKEEGELGEEVRGAVAPGAIRLQDATTGAWFADTTGAAPDALRWHLASDGRAAIQREEGRLCRAAGGPLGPVVLVHDPWRPVPGRGGHLGGEARLVDRADLDARSDVACFTSTPLERPQRLVGWPVLWLRVEADQPGFDLCAALAVVAANDATALTLCTGVLRVVGDEAQHPLERRLRFQPLAATLRAGERLRLSLAPAAWPQVAVNGGDGEEPRGGPSARHRQITLTLSLEGALLELLPLLNPGEEGVLPSADGAPPNRAAN